MWQVFIRISGCECHNEALLFEPEGLFQLCSGCVIHDVATVDLGRADGIAGFDLNAGDTKRRHHDDKLALSATLGL